MLNNTLNLGVEILQGLMCITIVKIVCLTLFKYMKIYTVLVLEDDLETVESIFKVFKELEDNRFNFSITVVPDYIKTNLYINENKSIKYDIVLLDRDCFLGGSFHNLNLSNFDIKKVISISSVPQYNNEAKEKGVVHIINKNYSNLENFKQELSDILKYNIL